MAGVAASAGRKPRDGDLGDVSGDARRALPHVRVAGAELALDVAAPTPELAPAIDGAGMKDAHRHRNPVVRRAEARGRVGGVGVDAEREAVAGRVAADVRAPAPERVILFERERELL